MRQLTGSMGLEQREIRTHASMATTPRKVFFAFEDLLYIVQYCINTAYFSPLQVKNKPSEGVEV
jgi:hypothetical protein